MSLHEFVPLVSLGPQFLQHDSRPTAVFSGLCPVTGRELQLPRTSLAERLAHEMMSTLKSRESKMFGILIARAPNGQKGVLKAFTGKWKDRACHPGWVPPMLELEPSALEISTKSKLDQLKDQLQALAKTDCYRQRLEVKSQWDSRERRLKEKLRERKRLRDATRKEGVPESELAALSREDSRRKRQFKLEYAEALAPSKRIESKIVALKRERKALSRALQAEMHARFEAGLWKGKPWSLASLFPYGPPTGTGECCAPKLLHFARRHNLEPLAMAEFWWGESTDTRRKGHFYPPCVERCQPLLGPLLSDATWALDRVYSDAEILIVEKPSGLLTVPGREVWNQDSVLARLEDEWGELFAVHRLDLETSGLIVLARNVSTLGRLQKMFSERKVQKTYEALLESCPSSLAGRIDDPVGRASNGRYRICSGGKSAFTEYQMLDPDEARIELKPVSYTHLTLPTIYSV